MIRETCNYRNFHDVEFSAPYEYIGKIFRIVPAQPHPKIIAPVGPVESVAGRGNSNS